METVNNIELGDENQFPSEEVLQTILGDSYSTYSELLKLFAANQMEAGWRYYQDGKAWLNKVQHKKRTIIWMSAWKGYMQATIYIPDKYIEQVYALDLSQACIEKIKTTKQVGKSIPCIFEIRNSEVLIDLNEVMQFKIRVK
jgi:hypothetical protein